MPLADRSHTIADPTLTPLALADEVAEHLPTATLAEVAAWRADPRVAALAPPTLARMGGWFLFRLGGTHRPEDRAAAWAGLRALVALAGDRLPMDGVWWNAVLQAVRIGQAEDGPEAALDAEAARAVLRALPVPAEVARRLGRAFRDPLACAGDPMAWRIDAMLPLVGTPAPDDAPAEVADLGAASMATWATRRPAARQNPVAGAASGIGARRSGGVAPQS